MLNVVIIFDYWGCFRNEIDCWNECDLLWLLWSGFVCFGLIYCVLVLLPLFFFFIIIYYYDLLNVYVKCCMLCSSYCFIDYLLSIDCFWVLWKYFEMKWVCCWSVNYWIIVKNVLCFYWCMIIISIYSEWEWMNYVMWCVELEVCLLLLSWIGLLRFLWLMIMSDLWWKMGCVCGCFVIVWFFPLPFFFFLLISYYWIE